MQMFSKMLGAELDVRFNPFWLQLNSLQSHVDYIGGQVEELGSKVECLEVCAEGNDFEEEQFDDDDEVEMTKVQNDEPQEAAHDTIDKTERAQRRTRRSAASVLANHGNGPGKKTETPRRLLTQA